MKTLTRTALAAAALAVSGAAAADTARTYDLGYWAKIDADTAVVYDHTMRVRYQLTFDGACDAMGYGKGAHLTETWAGRINGSFRDKMVFGKDACRIVDVERLNNEEYRALVRSRDIQIAGIN